MARSAATAATFVSTVYGVVHEAFAVSTEASSKLGSERLGETTPVVPATPRATETS